MKIVEFRIFMPLELQMCSTATAYSASKRMKQYSGGGDGFEIVEIKEYVENGRTWQYVYSIIHFKNKIPLAFRWLVPDKYAHVHSYNRISFPHDEGDFTIPSMSDDFLLHTETNHIEYLRSSEIPDNLNNFSEDELKEREIFYLDILDAPIPKDNDIDVDLHGYSCPEIGMTELLGDPSKANDKEIPSWVSNYEGRMTLIVKTVKFKFQWYGLQTLVEKGVVVMWYQVYLNLHRAMLKWGPDWCGLSKDELFQFENKTKDQLNENEFDM